MNKKGFTLVEILIVVAIIGILSSIALIGLGPVQKRGRDAKRISELKQIQAALELYYGSNGNYPNTANASVDLATLEAPLEAANAISTNSAFPKDPVTGWMYWYGSDGQSYTLGARLEDSKNPALNNDGDDASSNGVNCTDAAASPIYCIGL